MEVVGETERKVRRAAVRRDMMMGGEEVLAGSVGCYMGKHGDGPGVASFFIRPHGQ